MRISKKDILDYYDDSPLKQIYCISIKNGYASQLEWKGTKFEVEHPNKYLNRSERILIINYAKMKYL